MKDNDTDRIVDPYATDDPNVGDVHYGSPGEVHDVHRSDSEWAKFIRDSVDGDPDGYSAENVNAADNANAVRRSAAAEISETGKNALSAAQLRRRVQSKTRRAHRKPNAGVVATVLVFALVIGVCAVYLAVHGREAEPERSAPVGSVAATEAVNDLPSAVRIEVPKGFETVETPSAAIHEGDLILVNFEYEYVFPAVSDVVSVYDLKTKSYKVSDTLVSLSKPVVEKFNVLMDDFCAATGCGDMLVVSGFRDYESQQRIYTERVQRDGEEEAAKYVALPGTSEHHTALALDLSVYLSDGSSYYVEDYPLCDWFEEHAPEYGFILRYPSDKADVTHISFESWHYRFVGIPHGEIMTGREMCLEEYIDFIRSLECGVKYLAFRGGVSYESVTYPEDADHVIYFVPQSSGDITPIPVPAGAKYSISGNNVDGFIVTVDQTK